jgi:hypothetical protein
LCAHRQQHSCQAGKSPPHRGFLQPSVRWRADLPSRVSTHRFGLRAEEEENSVIV